MSFCKNCGTQLPDEAVFCANCGLHIDDEPRDAQTTVLTNDSVGYQPPMPEQYYAAPQPPVQGYPNASQPPYGQNNSNVPYGQNNAYNPYGQNQPCYYVSPPAGSSGLVKTTKVFLILGTILNPLVISLNLAESLSSSEMIIVFTIISLITLSWCLPMTIVYFHKIKSGARIGTGFKICTLIFVSQVAGILMLCDKGH